MALHALLLLSDSALPLGSFAFSSGLESHLAHLKTTTTRPTPQHLHSFLLASLKNHSSTLLPYVLSAHRRPDTLPRLNDTCDAATPCTVARRASAAQGRALAALWSRALRPPSSGGPAASAVEAFVVASSAAATAAEGGAHLAPLWGAVCAALGLDEAHTAYVFLLGHAKAVVSAGVRAGVAGPYHGQALLASGEVKAWIEGLVEAEMEREENDDDDDDDDDDEDGVGHAGVSVPVMDLWMGRHELLYSRIFNS